MPQSVTAIVLAGGRSSRFGGPKLQARLGDTTLVALAIRAVAIVADEIVVAGTALPDRIDDIGRAVRLVPDDRPFDGPLAALAGALATVTTPLAIVVGGDMPRLVPAVLRTMLDRLATDEAIDAVTLEGPTDGVGEQPRRAVLPLAVRVGPVVQAAAAAVSEGDRSLVRLVDRVPCVEIQAAAWRPLDPEGRTLFDVDRPEDLARFDDELH
jgi:molybdopterin-guanine dinucleotide biosynthesis protein A